MKSKKETVRVAFRIETAISPSDVPFCLSVKVVDGEHLISFDSNAIKKNQKSNKIIAIIEPEKDSLLSATTPILLAEDQIPVVKALIKAAFNAEKNRFPEIEEMEEIEFSLSIEDRREPKPSNEQHIRAALSTAVLLLSAAVAIALVATGAGWLAFCALVVGSALLLAATHAVSSFVDTQDVKRTMK